MGEFWDDEVAAKSLTSIGRDIALGSGRGILTIDPTKTAKEELDALCREIIDAPQPPLKVTSRQTITIDLNRHGVGEVYVWTKEEATLIRDALNQELGFAVRPQLYRDGVDYGTVTYNPVPTTKKICKHPSTDRIAWPYEPWRRYKHWWFGSYWASLVSWLKLSKSNH